MGAVRRRQLRRLRLQDGRGGRAAARRLLCRVTAGQLGRHGAAASAYYCPLNHAAFAVILMEGERSWNEAVAEPQMRSTLEVFFDGGQLPEGPMPEKMWMALAVALHRRIYHHLRRCLVEPGNLERRAAWGVFSLLETDDFRDPVMRHNTVLWDSCYCCTFSEVLPLMTTLAQARPVRRRIAEDVEFLDVWPSRPCCSPSSC
ncbi:hypothetical protein DFJ74DRAFT_654375 [Hyaloraphidium curvatum]|nr:hypothetical protein DFJ74DRAFT_654375 [Hyaloraphidium curvatum]